jgi:hypothetical protein
MLSHKPLIEYKCKVLSNLSLSVSLSFQRRPDSVPYAKIDKIKMTVSAGENSKVVVC